MWVFPDGFTPLFRAAAALPASLLMPVVELPPVPLPVVVPPVEEPAVAPLVAAPPVPELPPAEPPLDCARARELVKTSAVANPNVASFMIAPFSFCVTAQHDALACVPAWSITDRCCSPKRIPRAKFAADMPRKERKTVIAIRYVSHF
jgi:hypothetical protein